MRSGSKFFQGATGRALGLGLLALLIITPLSFLGLGHTLENQVLDLWYRLRPHLPPPPELLIVGIDESSFQELRQPWPWPRHLHATLIKKLAAAGARLIVFDVLFADPTSPEDDWELASAIKDSHVILAQALEVTHDPLFSRQILVQPLESLRRAARAVTLVMVTPDHDGVVRHFRLRLNGQETLPAAVARAVQPQRAIPPELSGLIHYVGPPRSIDTVSYYQVLDEARPLPVERVRDRIVLIGRMLGASATPQEQADNFYTPFFASTGQLMSGVEIQGNIIHNLLSDRWGRELPLAVRLLLYLAVALLASLLLARLSPLAGLGALVGLVMAVGFGSLYLFLRWDLWLPPVLLNGGLALIYSGQVLGHYLREAHDKRWMRQAFGRYVSHALVDIIASHPERLELGGEEVEVTVLFADLAGFTALSEGMAPRNLIRMLNEYFGAMSQIILAHQGTLDKYIGDAIMAHWGAPLPLGNHAVLACRAALQMQEMMPLLQASWLNQGFPALAARIGLHSGPVIAGNVGSQERFDYTVMGDTVNLASRLEGANKYYGTNILLSEATHRLVGNAFLVRELDQVQVKGRTQPVMVYDLVGPSSEDEPPVWLEMFARGRAAYLKREWLLAISTFREVLSLKPDDRPTELYLNRCLGFLHQGPPEDWDGVFILESK